MPADGDPDRTSDGSSTEITEFVPPPRTITGPGARRTLSDLVDENAEIHVVTDEGVRDAGIVDAVIDHLPTEPVVHANITANPSRSTVDALVEDLVSANLVLGIGGGSPMDATKAGCVLPAVTDRFDLSPESKLEEPDGTIPFILVPTTAGTGTETGYWAVITDHDRQEKLSLGHPAMMAEATIIDPELTTTLPPGVTAATGFDVITHAIESAVARGRTNMTLPYSTHAYELAIGSLKDAINNGENVTVRMRMLEASYLAGVAMNNAGLGMVHAISHAVGGVYDLPHGHLNALFLPAVIRRNGERSMTVSDRYGTMSSDERGDYRELANRVAELRRQVGLDGLPDDAPETWAWDEIAKRAITNVNAETNPVTYDAAEVVDLCRQVLDR